mgnify:CR=1 FL=1
MDEKPKAPARLKLDDLPEAPGVYLYRDRQGRIVYVEALDATGARVGAGCTDDVVVVSGESVDVTVTIFAL